MISDKDVVDVLSLAERYTQEGRYEGRLEGRLKGTEKMLELIKSGFSPEDAMRKANENDDWLNELQSEN